MAFSLMANIYIVYILKQVRLTRNYGHIVLNIAEANVEMTILA